MVSRYHSSKNDFWKLSERNSFLSPSSSLLREPKASERFSHHITIHPIPGISINRRNFLPGRSLLAKALEELRLLNWRAWKSNSEVSAVNSLCLQSSGVEHTRPSSLLAPGLGLGSSSCSFATSQASAPEPQLCPVHSTCNTLCLRSSWVELRTQVVALPALGSLARSDAPFSRASQKRRGDLRCARETKVPNLGSGAPPRLGLRKMNRECREPDAPSFSRQHQRWNPL